MASDGPVVAKEPLDKLPGHVNTVVSIGVLSSNVRIEHLTAGS